MKVLLRGRKRTYRLYRETKTKTVNFSLAATLIFMGVGSVLPLAVVGITNAISGVTYNISGFSGMDWSKDRRLPSGGWSVAGDSLSMTVDGNNPPANGFEAFEGVKAALPSGTNNISARLFIDPAWSDQTVIAGMWGEAPNGTDPTDPAWPTLEFNNVDNDTASVDVWDTFDGTIKGVTSVQYGSTIELEIQANTSTDSMNYYLNGVQIYTSSAHGAGPLTSVIFNNYNDSVAGHGYETVWSNFRAGTIAPPAAPTNLRWMVGGSAITCGKATNAPLTAPTWDTIAGVTSYDYQYMWPGTSAWRDGGTYTNPTTGPTAFGSTEGVEGTWQFRVRTNAPSGSSEWSNSCPITFDRTVPATPAAVFDQPSESGIRNLTKNNIFSFTLNNSSQDVTRYQLKYWNDIAGSPLKEASPWNPNDISGYMPDAHTYKDVFSQGQGQHYFSFSACDAAGNCSPYTAPTAVYYDSTNAVAALETINGKSFGSAVNTYAFDNKLIVKGSYSDNHASNYLQLELVKDGRLVDVVSHHGTTNNDVLATFDGTGLQNGEYELFATTTDMAGNVGSRERFVFTLDNVIPTPTVVGENFNTNNDGGWTGISVGFRLTDFKDVSHVAVTLRHNGENLVTNTENGRLLSLVNNDRAMQLSTPFITVPGSYVEEYWNLGAYSWSTSSPMPTDAVVTVIGTDLSGASRTATATLTPLSEGEPSWPTFSSILPAQPTASGANPQNQGVPNGFVQGAVTTLLQTPAPQLTTARSRVQGIGTNTQAAVLGDTTEQESSTETVSPEPKVLAAETSAPKSTVSVETVTAKSAKGFAWWWLVVIAAGILGLWWIIAAKRRSHKENR